MLDSELVVLGITDRKIKQLELMGLFTVRDLLLYSPRKHLDFTQITKLSQVPGLLQKEAEYLADLGLSVDNAGVYCAVIASIEKESVLNNYTKKYLSVRCSDGTGISLSVKWFNQNYLAAQLNSGVSYIFCGKITKSVFNGKVSYEMVNPMSFGSGNQIEDKKKIFPIYKKPKGMADEYILSCVERGLKFLEPDYLEDDVQEKLKLMPQPEAIKSLHKPESMSALNRAKSRIMFDEMFSFSMHLRDMKERSKRKSAFGITTMKKTKQLRDSLPFTLTEGQKDVLNELAQKMKDGHQINALVQGDVGCGKTIVAILLLSMIVENGYRGVLIAPTTILAEQHYAQVSEMLESIGYKTCKLTGNMTAKALAASKQGLKDGIYQVAVGTHAVIQDDVEIMNMGILIVDEQHRFGVEQKEILLNKAENLPHNIVMSATPIPRTLSMALYEDALDVCTIKTLPEGRKPIKTMHSFAEDFSYKNMIRELEKGRQCYVICPLVADSEAEAMAMVKSAEATFEEVKAFLAETGYEAGLVTGKMKKKEAEAEINRFYANEIQVLVATTVVEVGVNVPNASVIVIKNAERFGLAQLHQLRGRVGRGSYQSYCILETRKQNPKIDVMVSTNDGFVIAEEDLRLRGSGDYFGLKQSGSNKYIDMMFQQPVRFEKVKSIVGEIWEDETRREKYMHICKQDISDKSSDDVEME